MFTDEQRDVARGTTITTVSFKDTVFGNFRPILFCTEQDCVGSIRKTREFFFGKITLQAHGVYHRAIKYKALKFACLKIYTGSSKKKYSDHGVTASAKLKTSNYFLKGYIR